jgi:hypothetical protein
LRILNLFGSEYSLTHWSKDFCSWTWRIRNYVRGMAVGTGNIMNPLRSAYNLHGENMDERPIRIFRVSV